MNIDVAGRNLPPFVFWGSLWGLGAASALVLALFEAAFGSIEVIGRDFVNVWMAGKLFLEGKADTIFNVANYQEIVNSTFNKQLALNYSYPPNALLVTFPLGYFPYPVALIAWSVLGIAAFLWASRPYVPFAPVLSVATPASLLCLWFGHYGLFLGAIWLFFFRTLGTAKGGLAAAALTIKPHMGLLIALASLQFRRTLIWALFGTLAFLGASYLVIGDEAWKAFFQQTTRTQTDVLVSAQDGLFYFRMMPSPYVAYGRGLVAILAQIAFGLAALAIVIRSRPDPFIYATATFLIIPYVFIYDMTVVSLGFAIVLFNRWGDLSLASKAVATLGFLTPELNLFASFLVPPILLFGLCVLHRADGYDPARSHDRAGERASKDVDRSLSSAVDKI